LLFVYRSTYNIQIEYLITGSGISLTARSESR
jgi:hypothetical protein